MTHPRLELRAASRLTLGPLDLSLDAGQCLGISGESGSGKTLLLRLIADLDVHDGEVRLDGVEQRAMSPVAWRRQVAWVPAESAWWEDRVAPHFVAGSVSGHASLGFPEEIGAWEVARLSTGEKQRLGLLRALQNQPRVLLLDEPTASLDEVNTLKVEALIRQRVAEEGMAVIWVSHDSAQLQRVADRHMHMAHGRLEMN